MNGPGINAVSLVADGSDVADDRCREAEALRIIAAFPAHT